MYPPLLPRRSTMSCLHAFHVEVGKGHEHLGIGLFAEVLDVQVAGLVVHHVVGIDADDGYVAANDGEVLQVWRAVTLDAELDLRAFHALEVLHDVGRSPCLRAMSCRPSRCGRLPGCPLFRSGRRG